MLQTILRGVIASVAVAAVSLSIAITPATPAAAIDEQEIDAPYVQVTQTQPTCDTDGSLTLPYPPEDDFYYHFEITANLQTTSYSTLPTVVNGFAAGTSANVKLVREDFAKTIVFDQTYYFYTPQCVTQPTEPTVTGCEVTVPADTTAVHYTSKRSGNTVTVTATAQGYYSFGYTQQEQLIKEKEFTLTVGMCDPSVVTTTTPATPTELPHTGPTESALGLFVALVAAFSAYGLTYRFQPKRFYE